jgi:hypothetical protein
MRRLGQIQLAEYRALVASNRLRGEQQEQERAKLAREVAALLSRDAASQRNHSTQTNLQSSTDFTQDSSNNDRDEMLQLKRTLDNFDALLQSTRESIPATVQTQIQEMIQRGELAGMDFIAEWKKELSRINTKLRELELRVLDMEQNYQSLERNCTSLEQEQKKLLQSMNKTQHLDMQSMGHRIPAYGAGPAPKRADTSPTK